MNDQAIQAAFLQQLPEDVRQLERAWNALHTSSAWGEADRAGMIQATHRLAGVALTVGYSRIGHAARQVETYLHRPNFGDRCTCQQLVADLFTAIETRAYDGASAQARQVGQALKNVSSLHEARSSSLIYLIDDDPLLIDTLAAQMRYFGYSIQTFTRLDALHAALQHTLPAAILMDILFPKGELAGSESIQMLQGAYHQQLPVFFLSARDDVATRLHAIRIGGQHYFVKPVDIGALVDALDKVIVVVEPEPFRVLIVDDVEVQAKVNAMHLARADIHARMLTNPLAIVQTLEEFLPDLLLLDLYMPECTGLELAQVIRQIKTFVSLPIVYLSAETDREKQLVAVGLGGDDFLTKPIKPEHLISAVTSRIKRYREMRSLMLCDSLTGLYNHTSIRERLGQELARAARNKQPLALAMIDLDHFKKVNDTYGHATGDRVLKALTHLFTRRLRQSDVIGRYGGEEFTLILPNTTGDVALQVVDELREAFSQVLHSCEGQSFCLTFSCGVATFPKQPSLATLSEAADQAMYSAKRQGRNQVVLAE